MYLIILYEISPFSDLPGVFMSYIFLYNTNDILNCKVLNKYFISGNS